MRASAVLPGRVHAVTRRRVAAVVASAGLLLTATPAVAGTGRVDEAAALDLLEQAAEASRSLSYRGTQFVAAWHPSAVRSGLVEIEHVPGDGAVLSAAPTAGTGDGTRGLAAAGPDERLLDALQAQYALRVAGDGRCAGRDAVIVEARRSHDDGGTVAGRFWVDRDTGLLLRREVYDDSGQRLRSSAFLDLSVDPPSTVSLSLVSNARTTRDDVDLDALRDDGWPVPRELPDGFTLFDARTTDDGVLHLAYSDGLSTTSLFGQRGRLGVKPPDGFARRLMGGQPVWVHDGSPERVVWPGGDRVWTLVSDAPEDVVSRAVAALPHEELPRDGILGRLGRGLARLGSMLNPFS